MIAIAVFAVLLILSSCSEKAPVSQAGGPVQIIEMDGHSYYRGAAKVGTSDLSIELSYAVRNGRAYIDAVRIDGVEYRADCSGGAPESPEQRGGSSIPHYQYCEDGQGLRDLDFTCDGLRNPPPQREQPGPEHVRLKVEGNEEYLRERFETARPIEVLAPAEGGYTHPPSSNMTYNLTDGSDDFFYLDLKHRAKYLISTSGLTDTWGDLYLDDKGTIKPIAGAGDGLIFIIPSGGEFRGNFHLELVLDPGEYYLRVSPEKEGETGDSYRVMVSAHTLE